MISVFTSIRTKKGCIYIKRALFSGANCSSWIRHCIDIVVGTCLLLLSFRALLLHCVLSCLRFNLVVGFTLVPNLVHFGRWSLSRLLLSWL